LLKDKTGRLWESF